MWKESAQKLMQGWSKALRTRLRSQPQLQSKSSTKEVLKSSPVEKGLARPETSYRQTAKKVLDNFQQNVTSSPSYASAKEYSSKIRQSSSQYASDLSKRIPRDLPTKSELKEMAEPAKRVVKESIQSASSQASRLAKERIADPAQQALKKSAQQVSKSVQSASTKAASTASRIAQERIAQPAQQVLTRSSQSAQRVLEQSAQKATQSAKTASSAASQMAQSSRQSFFEELRSMRSDALKWLWWWSLAAIFVYGVATTLPGQLLREYNQTRRQKETKAIDQENKKEKDVRTSKKAESSEEDKFESSSISAWFSNGKETTPLDETQSKPSSWPTGTDLFQTEKIDEKSNSSDGSSFWPLVKDDKEQDKTVGASWWSWLKGKSDQER